MKRRVYLGHEVEDEDGETVGDGEVLRVPLMLMDHILPSRRAARAMALSSTRLAAVARTL
jgi:hypothetical protein